MLQYRAIVKHQRASHARSPSKWAFTRRYQNAAIVFTYLPIRHVLCLPVHTPVSSVSDAPPSLAILSIQPDPRQVLVALKEPSQRDTRTSTVPHSHPTSAEGSSASGCTPSGRSLNRERKYSTHSSHCLTSKACTVCEHCGILVIGRNLQAEADNTRSKDQM